MDFLKPFQRLPTPHLINAGTDPSCRVSSEEPPARVRQLIGVRMAFLGSVIYPGFKVGIEKPLIITKYQSRRANKLFFRERAMGVHLSSYHHPGYHTNWMLTVDYTRRRTGDGGFFTEFAPGIGLSRTILGGTTYRVDNGGQVSQVALAGNTYWMPSVAVGLGQDFNRTRAQLPLKLYTRLTLLALYPYNGTLHPRTTVEVGVLYSGFSFLKASTCYRVKQRH